MSNPYVDYEMTALLEELREEVIWQLDAGRSLCEIADDISFEAQISELVAMDVVETIAAGL